jgi:hypothetical protein
MIEKFLRNLYKNDDPWKFEPNLLTFYYMLKYGDWDIGTFKDFQISYCFLYYDGWHFGIRLGWFSIYCYH